MTDGLARDRLPRHVAFIMDGNGRWARARGLPRLRGHEEGAKALRRITQHSRRLGVAEMTVYALSSENYLRRPAREVAFLMQLLKRYLVQERPELEENNIRLKVIGEVGEFPAGVRRELERTMRLTEGFDGMVLRLALNYGSRQEILRAVRSLLAEVVAGRLEPRAALDLGAERFSAYFYDPAMPDPDLVVRTGGQFRLSNFLLWQTSYSELWVTECLWPDFTVQEYERALESYGGRERKFGSLSAGLVPGTAPRAGS